MNVPVYQARLLADLQTAQGNTILAAPTGAGARSVLARVLPTWCNGGYAVIVVDRLIAADQWQSRLAAAGVEAERLLSAEALLDAKGGRRAPVLITTLQRLRGTIGQQFMAGISPRVVVADLPISQGSTAQQVVEQLAQRARLVIVSDGLLPTLSWFKPDTVVRLSLREVLQGGAASLQVRTVRYDQPAPLRDLLEQGRVLLGKRGASLEHLSVQALHAELLRRVASSDVGAPMRTLETSSGEEPAEPELDPATRDTFWHVIDQLEAVQDDPRLSTLAATARDSVSLGRPCVVLVRLVAEALQLADELRARGLDALAITHWSERPQAAIDVLGERQVIVSTQSMLDLLSKLRGPSLVLWAPMRTADRIREVITWTALRGGVLVVLEPEGGDGVTAIVVEQISHVIAEGEDYY